MHSRAKASDPTAHRVPADAACPCGSARFRECCGRFLSGAQWPDTAPELMRARYSAFALGRLDFLRASWHPDTCPEHLGHDGTAAPRWLGLEIRGATREGDDEATVEFVARYRISGRGHRLHERSRFERVAGRWIYRDGVILS